MASPWVVQACHMWRLSKLQNVVVIAIFRRYFMIRLRDFILHLLKHELHSQTKKSWDSIYANSYTPLINLLTRVTRTSCIWIHNISNNDCSIDDNLFKETLTANLSDNHILFDISNNEDNIDYKIVKIINESQTLPKRKISKYWLVVIELLQRLSGIFLDIFIHCWRQSVMDYSHSDELTCDVEIPFLGWQKSWNNPSKIEIIHTGFQMKILYLMTFQSTIIMRTKCLAFLRKRRKRIIENC